MTPQPRRADARRSRAAILDAALRLLNADPETRLETIAADAGVTRQTVYAHFPNRDTLLAAVVERVTEEVAAAMDAAEPDADSAADALLRLLAVSSEVAQRYPLLRKAFAGAAVPVETDRRQHEPILDRIRAVIARGQNQGEFDGSLPAQWFATVTVELAHAAAYEADAGRMSAEESDTALRATLLRALAATE